MKKIISYTGKGIWLFPVLIVLVVSGPALADCRTVAKYNKKIDMTIKVKHGDRHCVIRDWMAKDHMVLGYWLDASTLNIVINNIRNQKDIDLAFYGFNKFQGANIAEQIDEAKKVRFVKMYSKFGIPRAEIEKKMEYRR